MSVCVCLDSFFVALIANRRRWLSLLNSHLEISVVPNSVSSLERPPRPVHMSRLKAFKHHIKQLCLGGKHWHFKRICVVRRFLRFLRLQAKNQKVSELSLELSRCNPWSNHHWLPWLSHLHQAECKESLPDLNIIEIDEYTKKFKNSLFSRVKLCSCLVQITTPLRSTKSKDKPRLTSVLHSKQNCFPLRSSRKHNAPPWLNHLRYNLHLRKRDSPYFDTPSDELIKCAQKLPCWEACA